MPPFEIVLKKELNHSLIKHSVGYFHKTCYVGASHIIDVITLRAVLHSCLMNTLHDVVKALVHFFACPRKS